MHLYSHPVLAADGSGAHVETQHRERTGHPPQQTLAIGRNHRDRSRLDFDRRARAAAISSRWRSVGTAASGSGRPASTVRTRPTRSAMSPAFQSLHAVGPVALLSASVSAASSSRVSRSPTAFGHRVDRRRIVEVAPGGDIGEQQVMPHHSDERVDVLGRKTHARCRCASTSSMPTSVWSPGGPCRCRGAARRRGAGRAARRRGRARRRWPPPRTGDGRR